MHTWNSGENPHLLQGWPEVVVYRVRAPGMFSRQGKLVSDKEG